ncbi:MAG: peptide deformylase [Lachnospiraceae bacterium]|nr:peptide deformylase [Lachnospiraceae bacterium]
MAIRVLRIEGDPILNKKSREIKEITPRIRELAEDMIETMYSEGGVGLAGPQVGVLKRIAVIDVGEGPIVFINPEIIESSGEQEGFEGCLSVPGKRGVVKRPMNVKARAFDLDMNPFEVEGEELFARAMCHEFEHLDGHLYTEKVEPGTLTAVAEDEEYEEEEDGENS